MRVPLIRFSEAQIEAGGAPTFQYRFTYGFTDPEGRTRSAHGSDMPYFFANIDKAPIADGPHAAALAGVASGSLLAFARTGDPNNDAAPNWPRYSIEGRATMRIDVEPELLADPAGADRAAWSSFVVPGLRG
jgi:para-nitrobenzyl esterase